MNKERLQDYIGRKAAKWALDLETSLMELIASQPGSMRERAARLKLMFRKFDDDRTMETVVNPAPRGVCPCRETCMGVLENWVYDCSLPIILVQRESRHKEIIAKLEPYPSLKNVFNSLLRHESKTALIWRGIWTRDIVQDVHTAAIQDRADFKEIQPIMLQISMILINAALTMRATRPYGNKTNVPTRPIPPQRQAFSNAAKQRRSQATATLLQFGFTIAPS